jgi:hypothetical protein
VDAAYCVDLHSRTFMERLQVFPADEHAALTSSATLAAIRTIRANLPFHDDLRLTSIAHDVLLLLHYVPAPSWRLGMALCMNQQTHLQQVRRRAMPQSRACVLHCHLIPVARLPERIFERYDMTRRWWHRHPRAAQHHIADRLPLVCAAHPAKRLCPD